MSHEPSGTKEVPFTINGRPMTARPGETVLSVAKRHGIPIPTLCHHDAVSDLGACRVCVVEVFWGKRSKLVTSCLYTPYENDAVVTDNERVRRTRRMVLELLAARCPGVQLIRDMAREYGVDVPRFEPDEASEEERCILCGLCVRVCAEVVGLNAIGYASRGMGRSITTPFDAPSAECIGCGACVAICPTGALHYEDVAGRRIMKELHTELPMVSCSRCGRPFAPAAQVAFIRQGIPALPEIAEMCPACRKQRAWAVAEKSLGKSVKRKSAVPAAAAALGVTDKTRC